MQSLAPASWRGDVRGARVARGAADSRVLMSAITIPALDAARGASPATRRRALLRASDDALAAKLVELALALRDPALHEALASAVALPVAEVAASPRDPHGRARGGAWRGHGARRSAPGMSSPRALTGEEGTRDAAHGQWDRGVLRLGKYQQFLQDEPFATFHADHVSKWGPREPVHRAVGFFFRPGCSRWEALPRGAPERAAARRDVVRPRAGDAPRRGFVDREPRAAIPPRGWPTRAGSMTTRLRFGCARAALGVAGARRHHAPERELAGDREVATGRRWRGPRIPCSMPRATRSRTSRAIARASSAPGRCSRSSCRPAPIVRRRARVPRIDRRSVRRAALRDALVRPGDRGAQAQRPRALGSRDARRARRRREREVGREACRRGGCRNSAGARGAARGGRRGYGIAALPERSAPPPARSSRPGIASTARSRSISSPMASLRARRARSRSSDVAPAPRCARSRPVRRCSSVRRSPIASPRSSARRARIPRSPSSRASRPRSRRRAGRRTRGATLRAGARPAARSRDRARGAQPGVPRRALRSRRLRAARGRQAGQGRAHLLDSAHTAARSWWSPFPRSWPMRSTCSPARRCARPRPRRAPRGRARRPRLAPRAHRGRRNRVVAAARVTRSGAISARRAARNHRELTHVVRRLVPRAVLERDPAPVRELVVRRDRVALHVGDEHEVHVHALLARDVLLVPDEPGRRALDVGDDRERARSPVSSRSSRIAASSGVSPSSISPPGGSHTPSRLCAIKSTRSPRRGYTAIENAFLIVSPTPCA